MMMVNEGRHDRQQDEFFHHEGTLFPSLLSGSHARHHGEASSSTQQHRHCNHDSWNRHRHHPRNHENQQSNNSLLFGRQDWMERPYNASPLSWFQRYYYYQGVASGNNTVAPPPALDRSFRRRRRDEFYTSSGSISTLMAEDEDGDNPQRRCCPQQPHPCAEDCCEVLCGALCCLLCCGCCKRKQYDPVATANGQASPLELRRSASFSRYKASTGFCLVFFLTILLPMTLLHASRGDGTWILHAGESHRIFPAFMNHGVTVTSSLSSSGEPFSVQVYAAQGACPPLTGPPQIVAHVENLTLAQESFEYHFFYLNKGSNVSAHVATTSGVVDVYFLQGQHSLRQSEKSSFDPEASQFVLKKQVRPGQVVEFHEIVNATDTYILLYDNAKTSNASLSVGYELAVSTYDWQQQPPACSHAEAHPCTLSIPLLAPWQKQCFVVQTTLPAFENGHDEPVRVGEHVATVHIAQHRRFGWIIMISFLPLLVYSFWPSACHEDEDPQPRPYDEIYRVALPVPNVPSPPQTGVPYPAEARRAYLANVTNYSAALSTHSYQRSLNK